MRKPVRFVHSLSFKLALTTVGMLLVLWLTVGTVLVLSTAQEIIDNGPPLADSRLNLYRSDSYLQTFDPQTLDDSWVLEAQKASSGSSLLLFYDMYDGSPLPPVRLYLDGGCLRNTGAAARAYALRGSLRKSQRGGTRWAVS